MPKDQLLSYQKSGAETLAKRAAGGCFDEPGLGKTPLSVHWLDLKGAKTAYVLTTASHTYGFAAEIEKWQTIPRSVAVDDWTADVCITTHDRVVKWNLASAPEKDAIIIDEAHRLKSSDSQRTKAVYGEKLGPGEGLVGRVTKGALLLSGSITPNYQTELYTHFARLWPKLLRTPTGRQLTEEQFARAYTAGVIDTRTGKWKPRANRRTKEMRAMLEKIAIWRTHKDVGNQMPPARINRVPLAQTLEEHLTGHKGVRDELRQGLEEISRWIMAGHSQGKTDAELLSQIMDEAELPVASVRRLLGQTKVRSAANYIRDLLDGGERKVAVFGVHTPVIEGLRSELMKYQPAVITGSTPAKLRQGQVKMFQDYPQCRVFLGNIQAAGEAITLTAARRMVIVESTWTPKDDLQVIARLRRYGQTGTVLVDYLTVPCAIEEMVYGVNRRKLSGNKALWG